MLIDFHTHTFPDPLAERVVDNFARSVPSPPPLQRISWRTKNAPALTAS